MPRFKFNKLVRDKIIEHQESSGMTTRYRLLTSKQHKEHLIKKIIEEAKEILEAKPNVMASEIADVQQAIDDLIWKTGLTKRQIKAEQDKKLKKNGSFKRGIYIEYTDVPEQNEWLKYYSDHYDREDLR